MRKASYIVVSQNSRYYQIGSNNEVIGALGPECFYFGVTVMPIITSFTELSAAVIERSKIDGSSIQSTQNRLTALNRAMHVLEIQPGEPATALLRVSLPATLERLKASGAFANRRLADVSSHLRWLSTFLHAYLSGEAAPRVKPRADSQFTIALVAAFKESGLTQADVVRLSGVSAMTYCDWLKGRQPRKEGRVALPRVEKALGLPAGALMRLVTKKREQNAGSDRALDYRARMALLLKSTYRVPIREVLPTLKEQWDAFFKYKLADTPTLFRSASAGWTTKKIGSSRVRPTSACVVGDDICPSAQIYFLKVAGLIGFMRLPVERGGWGLPDEVAQTMAWFAVPEAVQAHFMFMRSRTTKVNNGLRNFSNFVCSLVGNRWGWLHQRPDLRETLPESALRGRTWDELCMATYRLATNLSGKFEGCSRVPGDAIASVIEDSNPLAKLMSVVLALDTAADKYPIGSRCRSTAKRDALIIALLTTLPIRSENLAALRVTNNSDFGYVSPTGDKRYLLRALVTKTRGTSSGGEYSGITSEALSARIDEYLQVHRPTLLRGRESDFLFVSSKEPGQIWRNLNSQVYDVIRRHLPDSPGFGPHSFRHIVATAFLDAHPDQEHVVAALLGITVETLRKHYYQPNQVRAAATHGVDVDAAMREAKKRDTASNRKRPPSKQPA